MKLLPLLAALSLLIAPYVGSAEAQTWAQVQLAKAQPAALPVEQAFRLSVVTARNGEIAVRWEMPAGYYLYGTRLHFTPGQGLKIGTPLRPRGEMKNDPHFGRVEIYRNQLVTTLPRQSPEGGTIAIRFQGCAEQQNVCYPPVTRTFRIPAVR